ncbi:MAG: TolC family protein [Polynucleobacter sp.]|nr:TolC family protein [Polynucleobacter sp.]
MNSGNAPSSVTVIQTNPGVTAPLNAAPNILPKPITPQELQKLELPPQIAIPTKEPLSNISKERNGAYSGPAMDLISLYQEAAFSDPVINSARFANAARKEFYWQGLSYLLPQVVATPQGTRYYQHGVGSTVVSSNPGNSRLYDQKSYTVTLTQPVFNVASLEVFKQGDLNTKIGDLTFLQATQDLAIRVAQAYFDVLFAHDNVDLYKKKKDLIQQQLETAKARFEVGLATIVDANDAQARYDVANSQEIASQADLIVKQGVLEQLIGRPVGAIKPLAKDSKIDSVVQDPLSKLKNNRITPITAESVNPLLPVGQRLEDWINQAETANYGVMAGQLNMELAQSTYRASLATNYPSVNLVGSAGYNTSNGLANSYNPTNTNVYNNSIALQMNLPIFSGGYNTSLIRQNAALFDKAKADYDNLRRSTAQNTRQAFMGFYGGLATVKALEAAERSSAAAVESSKLGYQVGTLVNLDVLISFDTLYTTRATLYKARYDTIVNALKLKAYAASLDDTDLVQVNALLR